MERFPSVFVVIFFALLSIKVSAECTTAKNVDAVVECLLKGHPQLTISKADFDIANANVSKSSQFINPTLDWELTEAQGASGFTNELALMQTIELGSKRTARKKLAQVQKDIQSLGYQKVYNKLKINLILDLYRLRQIEHESEIIEENQTTFKRMIAQYKRIGRMNPEQEISVNIFSMAASEVQLKLQKLKNEKDKILSEFALIGEQDFKPKPNQLPPIDHNWPDLSIEQSQGVLQKEATLKIEESNKNYKLQNAEAWPNISVGPRLITSPGPQGGTFWGGAISLELPILNSNKSGKTKALAIQKKSKLNGSLLKRRIEVEAKRLKNAYQRSSTSYTKALSVNEIQKKHARVHRMIKRGVVSPPLVIELHRQAIEFYEALHQQELEAVKARWLYYSLFSNLDNKKIVNIGGAK